MACLYSLKCLKLLNSYNLMIVYLKNPRVIYRVQIPRKNPALGSQNLWEWESGIHILNKPSKWVAYTAMRVHSILLWRCTIVSSMSLVLKGLFLKHSSTYVQQNQACWISNPFSLAPQHRAECIFSLSLLLVWPCDWGPVNRICTCHVYHPGLSSKNHPGFFSWPSRSLSACQKQRQGP